MSSGVPGAKKFFACASHSPSPPSACAMRIHSSRSGARSGASASARDPDSTIASSRSGASRAIAQAV